MELEDYKARARRGKQLLEEKAPQYKEKYDPIKMDIENNDTCMLGLTFGSYWDGLKALFNIEKLDRDEIELASPYGFTLPEEVQMNEYNNRGDWILLQQAWGEVMQED